LTNEDWKEAWRFFELARGAGVEERRSLLADTPPHIVEEVEALIEAAEHADHDAPEPGRDYGKYTLVAPLGSGGMGEVFSARDSELGRMVAIKFVGASSRLLPAACERLVHEAQAASALNHPNLVTVHEVLRFESSVAIVTELVKGQSLRTFTGAPLPIQQVATWGAQIAHALAAAHAESIVHSDIKPENVMLRADGYLKILDFGLARNVGLGLAMDDLTLGTVGYMSPEQTRGEPLTGATDVFSLGVMLVELATGKHPFLADTPGATTVAITQSEVDYPPPAVPGGKRFAALVKAMLDKNPARRPFMADAARALERVVSRQARRNRRRIIWASGALAAIAAGGLLWLRPGRSAASFLGSPVAITNYTGIEDQPAFSPDGRTLAFVWSGPDGRQHDVYIRSADAINATPRRVTNDLNEEFSPVFSPDGKYLAWRRRALGGGDGELWIAPVSGLDLGPARLVAKTCADWGFQGLAWTPDSRSLIARDKGPRGFPLVLIRVRDGSKAYLTDAHNTQDYHPVMSPDRKRLLFQRFSNSRPQICYARLGPPLMEPVCRDIRSGLGSATWTLDSGSILLSSADALWLMHADGGRSGGMTKLRDGVFSNLVTDVAGKRYAYNRTITDANIWQLDIPTQRQSQLISSSEEDSEPDFSPDGSRILFRSNRTGNFELYVSDGDGSDLRQITRVGGHCGSARWSPNGKWIAYDSRQDYPGPKGVRKFDNIYVMPAEGGPARRLTNDDVNSVVPNWSADSQWVYYSLDDERQAWKVPLNGGAPVLVAAREMWGAVESADGKWIYYEQPTTGKGLWRRSVAGGPDERIAGTENLTYRTWEVRRDFLVFLRSAPNPGFFRISLAKDTIGGPRFAGPGPRRVPVGPGTMSVSPDGSTILYTSEDLTIGDIYVVSPADTNRP
jgi:Tol biopolymer transport system component